MTAPPKSRQLGPAIGAGLPARLKAAGRMLLASGLVFGLAVPVVGQAAGVPASFTAAAESYCVGCHGPDSPKAGLDIRALMASPMEQDAAGWELVAKKLRGRQMPPRGLPRPDDAGYRLLVSDLAAVLDAAAARNPKPGRTDAFRRLNRTEYRNAIRDLLALDVRVESLLPADEASHGFDNITVADLPPTLLERYVSAAEKISRIAVGRSAGVPDAETFRVPPDLTQEGHVPGLPIGTRGGVVVPHTFPVTGEYEVRVRLARDRNEDIEGLDRPHEMELLIDERRVALFDVKPPPRGDDERNADSHLRARLKVEAGQRIVGAAFLKDSSVLLETQRQPYMARFNFYRHPRTQPAVYSLTVIGPHSGEGAGRTASRQRIFACQPASPEEGDACALEIVASLARRAYRRPVAEAELEGPLRFFRAGRAEAASGDPFEAGIERALAAILVSPQFLFRIERQPPAVAPGTAYGLAPLELASRLAFFLWSSLPDEELLAAAETGALSSPDGLERQARRMLRDPRSESLVGNFAAQWLHIRNLDSIRPDMRRFPDFDHNLRMAFREETERLLSSVIREDRSILDLLRPGYTFLNERLAKHYGFRDVYGSHFRRVDLGPGSRRGGLLRHGSVLTVTSYATRTSPVIRGKWVLENLLGMPPPPSPENVPELKESTSSGKLSVRDRLAEHRADPACASCHDPMDPLGFALENYDAVGRWRDADADGPIDPSGELSDGATIDGVDGLERALLRRPELFATALTEKLLTFALGRGVEHHDAPTVRGIVARASRENFRFSALIVGISGSVPFTMREAR